jgi:cob(I)alamin adenosyltransferase
MLNACSEPPLRDSAGISPDFAQTVQGRHYTVGRADRQCNRLADLMADDSTSTTDALEEDPRPDGLRSATSLVIVNTGNGKGKSSSAFGMMLRALAIDWPVAVVQFVKSGNWKVGEEKLGRQLGADWRAFGDGFTWESDDLDNDKAHAAQGWSEAKALIQAGEHRLVILDELTYLCTWGWIDQADVIDTIANRPEHVNVIVTGRDAPKELIEIADTVTEMVEVKHAYQQGIRAKRGLDY